MYIVDMSLKESCFPNTSAVLFLLHYVLFHLSAPTLSLFLQFLTKWKSPLKILNPLTSPVSLVNSPRSSIHISVSPTY